MKDFAKSLRTENQKVGNEAIVLKDGNVWVVLYANETKSKEFDTEAEARSFAKQVGNSKVGNEATGPNWDKKRQLEDELRGWMTMVNKLEGEEKQNAEKQIADIHKELNDVKIKIAHGENKKAGNESIEKQEWSMFKGLSKDAEKEVGNETYQHKLYPDKYVIIDGKNYKIITDGKVEKSGELTDAVLYGINQTYKRVSSMNSKTGNAYTPNPELIKILEAWLHNRMSEQEARSKIMKITGDKNITDMMIHSPGGFIPAGNKKTGNETAEEKKFGKVMREFDRGELKSSSGKTVTDPEQAKAIAYSEAEKVDNLKRARNSIKKG